MPVLRLTSSWMYRGTSRSSEVALEPVNDEEPRQRCRAFVRSYTWRINSALELKPAEETADYVGMQETRGRDVKRLTAPVILLVLQLVFLRFASAATTPLFGSTIGGDQTDTVWAVATDSYQNIYLVGETYSTDFPGAPSLSTARRAGDAFVVKLNSSGTQILYTLVLSGSGRDYARGVAVDSAGYVYVTGVTTSPDFPTTTGAFQRSSNSPGFEEVFVAKLSPTGAIVYSTLFGGSGSDKGFAIANDSSGAAYITGSTTSRNLPVTNSATQRTFQGGLSDCFVAKFDPSGSTLSYATYLGGESADVCNGIAVDSSGSAFVTGTTSSFAFPIANSLKSALDTASSNAFLTKFSAAGDRILFHLPGWRWPRRWQCSTNRFLGGPSMLQGTPRPPRSRHYGSHARSAQRRLRWFCMRHI